MKDLTQGSVAKHLLSMAAFIAMGLAFQSAYFLIDLYFVAERGPDVLAGVGAAGNSSFLVIAASQLVGVGVTSLIARAIGRKDMADARLVFNQAIGMSGCAALATLALGAALAAPTMHELAANAASARAGRMYLYAAVPSFAAMFPMTALTSALRGAGVVRPTMIVQTGSVLLNAILAPILIAGWLTHMPLGAAGAGLATTIASVIALIGLTIAFPGIQRDLGLARALLVPRLKFWWRIVGVGLPVAGEFAMMFVITTIIYWVIRGFGAPAQAGFGIGSRIMTATFLPAMAIAFAVAPVAGQNMGAGRPDRVRRTFYSAAWIISGVMLALSVLCHWRPDVLIAVFTTDPAVSSVAASYLSVLSWNFVAAGLVFVCSGMFQAMGNTIPSFLSSLSRLVTYGLPAVILEKTMPGIALRDFWYLSVVSVGLQALFSLLLLRRELRRKLGATSHVAATLAAAAADVQR